MTLEELQAALEEQKASNEALASKNRELLGELKAARKNTQVDPEEFERVRNELEATRETLEKVQKQSKSDIEKLTKTATEKDAALQRYLIDGGLADALAKAGVAPPLMDAAKALFRSQAAIKADNDQMYAVIGDKTIADYIGEWAASEQGKHFVLAPRNVGGGAVGGANGASGKAFGDMTSEERTQLFRSNPQQYEALKAASKPAH